MHVNVQMVTVRVYEQTSSQKCACFEVRKASASSVPCLAKKDVENNCSTRHKHEIKTKHPGMASEPLLPLVNSNAEKSEETIIECCQSTGGKDITTACKDTHLLSQRKGGSLSSLEYYFFCSQSGPVVKEKGHDGRKPAGESRSQSLQVLNSCASSSASTSQLPVNLCDNLTETRSIVTVKAKYQGSKSLEEQSIASDLSKGTELRESCGLMCRICHSGFEEGELIRPCKCTGTVKHAHQSCILNWVSKSGNQNCELCKFKFRTHKESVKCFWKWRFPEVSTKGWLHIGLFIAFATMLLTSITWIIWSRVSRTPSAIAERTTEEVKFAYMVNGLFIALAVGGLYFDSLKHFKQYSKRWSALNQNVIVECYVSDNESKVEGIGVPCTSDKHHQSFVSMAVEETEMGRLSNKPGNNHRNDPEAWV